MTAVDKAEEFDDGDVVRHIPDEEFVQWLEWLDNVEDDFDPSWIEYLKGKKKPL